MSAVHLTGFSSLQPGLKRWWPCLLILGPITGMLVALFLVNLRAGRPVLAGACVAALAAFWIGAPALLGAELSLLPAGLRL